MTADAAKLAKEADDGGIIMEEYLYNVDNGYLEGLVRGFRSGILTRTDYINLVQCETIEGELNLMFTVVFIGVAQHNRKGLRHDEANFF